MGGEVQPSRHHLTIHKCTQTPNRFQVRSVPAAGALSASPAAPSEVTRRFRDFSWLQHKMQERHKVGEQQSSAQFSVLSNHEVNEYMFIPTPSTFTLYQGVIVPPLPEKSAVQKFQMSAEFIDQRRKALQVWKGCGRGGILTEGE